MTIDDALNTLARKFSTFDDLKEMGNYYIEECKSTLLEIIKGAKLKKSVREADIVKFNNSSNSERERIGQGWSFKNGFNQGVDTYEKQLENLFK